MRRSTFEAGHLEAKKRTGARCEGDHFLLSAGQLTAVSARPSVDGWEEVTAEELDGSAVLSFGRFIVTGGDAFDGLFFAFAF